eukprot:TRINITY_DN10537_c0_g1_i1.p1 TRINITY_DN10537_c0_g1~~TRINITY_DN10537_c0_g1_i1.p1  ORF type:complete len:214 (+),score=68.31 TRINITY_DN10537_c0_g1_i1:70-642(+)
MSAPGWDLDLPSDMPTDLPPPTDRPVQVYTLLFVRKDGRLLMGRKARGFGTGKWNGFGGKVDRGKETIDEAALRELKEEAGVEGLGLRRRGVLFFWFDPEHEKKLMEVHLYQCDDFVGEYAESEEMHPIQWWDERALPAPEMWADDEHWMPFFLEGSPLLGCFQFGDLSTILRKCVVRVSEEHLALYRHH